MRQVFGVEGHGLPTKHAASTDSLRRVAPLAREASKK
eukprot:CAMPEP_0179868018 /NCGR_PEP_ID=MMETSP0982-20121206/18550_1 /TAXON_ID=483367 /ORGANISM="non described non described, Strain CCMP 2436" /LENGTH=36 /DNA_ID= /DNA_START= /DNA_END= /DNA_ORIENTATION=